jgi:tetratricopeptide (TPR) repeat protein
VYRELRSRLDAARPADAERLLWLFENSPDRDAVLGEMAVAAAAAAPPDSDLNRAARLVAAQVAADGGRPEEAERLLRELLDEHRGTGHRYERLSCLSLAKLYAHQRRGYEALVLSRAAAVLARKGEHPWDLCVARSRICMALQVLQDRERLAAAVEELDRSLDEVPAERARPLRFLVEGWKAEAALEAGELEQAAAALAAQRATADDRGAMPGDDRHPVYLKATLAWRSGKHEEALALVDRAREIPARLPASDLPLSLLEARCLAATNRTGEALRRLESMLDLLEEEAAVDTIGSGQRIRYAVRAGRLLEKECASPTDARRAFDIAANWALRRVVEIERAMAAVPELEGIQTADLKTLTEFRSRFMAEHGEILDRLASVYGGDTPPESLLVPDPGGSEETFFRACAWCRRVRSVDGRWLPVGEFVPDDRQLRISHGICKDCHARWLERLRKSPEA